MVDRSWDMWLAQLERERLPFAAMDGDMGRVEALLAAGYSANRFDDLGMTPLHYAVEHGHMAAVERLLEAGADVNAHDERVIGNTPLSDTVEKIPLVMVNRLIAAGADPTIRGWMQLSAIDRAEDRTDEEAGEVMRVLKEAAGRLRRE